MALALALAKKTEQVTTIRLTNTYIIIIHIKEE
jgi:hypothetical protein